MGSVTGRGIAGNLRREYPPLLGYVLVALLSVANTINLGADVGAMGAALQLLIAGPAWAYVCFFGLLSVLLAVFVRYTRYASLLKWLCLSLLSYVVCVFVVEVSWPQVVRGLLRPTLTVHADYVMAIVAVFGTTISPYLFFWQAQQEVEEGDPRRQRRPASQVRPRRIQAHPPRHPNWYGPLQRGGDLHHHRRRRHAAFPGSDDDRVGRAGRGSTAPARRALYLRGVCRGYHRHRAADPAGAGGIRCLRGGRAAVLARRPEAAARRREGVLRGHRGRHVARAVCSTSRR